MSPIPAPGNSTLEWEARLYDSSGHRIRMPLRWVEGIDFELGEQGGCLNGSMKLLAAWEELRLTGTERVDVWLWGQLVYRGWVRMPQDEASVPERKSPTLQGLMETLRGYQVRRPFAYVAETDVGDVFRDLVSFYVARPGRLPGVLVDSTGVSALNITLQSFDASNRDFAQAMNDLCNVSPGSLIWGCDVEPTSGRDRIYLRPRSSAVRYKYSVGDKVSTFVYPQDTSQVVNAVYVTGAEQTFPNLAPNASFERPVAPGELTGNLLQSPSFEDASGGTIPIYCDRHCPKGTFFALRMADWGISCMGELLHFQNGDGMEILRVYNSTNYEARLISYPLLYNRAPKNSGRVSLQ